MPIKMTGSVRPTSLTSPDPITMPIVNKLPALKAKVIDIRDNGPGVPGPVVAGPSPYATGLLIETDVSTPGDAKATLHTTSGLEWLDLSETISMSVNQVTALLGTTYAGWRLPTYDEVKLLIDDTIPHDPFPVSAYLAATAYDQPGALDWQSKIGTIDGPIVGLGMYYESGSTTVVRQAGVYTPLANFLYFGRGDYSPDTITTYSGGKHLGVFLVSDGGTTLSSIANPDINTPAV